MLEFLSAEAQSQFCSYNKVSKNVIGGLLAFPNMTMMWNPFMVSIAKKMLLLDCSGWLAGNCIIK